MKSTLTMFTVTMLMAVASISEAIDAKNVKDCGDEENLVQVSMAGVIEEGDVRSKGGVARDRENRAEETHSSKQDIAI